MYILSIVGARPQFVKVSAFHRAITEHKNLVHFILHTGQHYDKNMSNVFFEEMQIPSPNVNLNIGGGTHGENTGRMIEQIEKILIKENPDWVILFGDTDSTLSGAIAASKIEIPIAHVEAGLRSWNRSMPEEINRILTDNCSNVLFSPSEIATQNLLAEGIDENRIISTGDIMFDVAIHFKKQLKGKSNALASIGLKTKNYALATIHRAENTKNKEQLKAVMDCISCINQVVILPLHPRTAGALKAYGLKLPSNVKPVNPIGYKDMLELEMNASLIATDSGGVQKEAYFNKVPCITLRKETEWIELVDAGVNFIVGSNKKKMKKALRWINENQLDFSGNLYGDGRAAQKMVETLLRYEMKNSNNI